MKKYFILIAMAIFVLSVACSKSEDEQTTDSNKKEDNGGNTEETIKVSLSVSDIADNQATISISLSEGSFHGATLVEAVNISSVDIDYTNEIRLINFVKENGVDVDLPYTNTITGLKDGAGMFSAVIVYDSNGTAVNSDYSVWTAIGSPEGWSVENDAGSLNEIKW